MFFSSVNHSRAQNALCDMDNWTIFSFPLSVASEAWALLIQVAEGIFPPLLHVYYLLLFLPGSVLTVAVLGQIGPDEWQASLHGIAISSVFLSAPVKHPTPFVSLHPCRSAVVLSFAPTQRRGPICFTPPHCLRLMRGVSAPVKRYSLIIEANAVSIQQRSV